MFPLVSPVSRGWDVLHIVPPSAGNWYRDNTVTSPAATPLYDESASKDGDSAKAQGEVWMKSERKLKVKNILHT